MKKTSQMRGFLCLFLITVVFCVQSSVVADDIGDRVITHIEKNIATDPNPRLALVGWWYAISDYRLTS